MIVEKEDFVILLLDSVGNISSGDNKLEKIKGYTQDEVIGKNQGILYTEENQETGLPEQLINEAARKGKAIYEGWSVRKNGTKFWSSIIITALYNKQGEVSGYSKVTYDLTQKNEEDKLTNPEKTATYIDKEELIKSEGRFRALIEHSFDAISLINKNGVVLYQSPSTERMLGYKPEEMIGKFGFDFFHPDDKADAIKRIEAVIKNPGVPVFRSNRMRHKDGHYIWTEGTTTNLLDEDGVNAIVGNFRDITERKLADEKIKQSEANLKAVFENSLESMIITDTTGNVLSFNNNAQKTNLLTCTIPIKTGANMLDYIDPSRKELFKDLWQRVASGESIRYDQSFTDFSGEAYTYNFSIYPIIETGKIIGICMNGRNITEQKLAEKKIVHANYLYSFISQINKTILRATDEQTVFKEACRIATETGKFSMAWIGELNSERTKIHYIDGFGIPAEDRPLFIEVPTNTPGAQSYVLENDSAYLCNDVDNTQGLPGWRQFSGRHGLKSCMVLPIKRLKKIIGTFNLYSTEKGFFDKQEVDLLEEVARDISFAMDAFENERQRKQMEQTLVHNRMRLKQAQAIANLGSWEYDFVNERTLCSEEYCNIYGQQASENAMTAEVWFSFVHPDDLVFVSATINETRQTLKDSTFNYRIIRRDGSIRYIHAQTNFEFDKDQKHVGTYGIIHDITAQKEAEEKINIANRMYAFTSQINETIVHVTDEQKLFDEVCRIAISVGEFELACIDTINEQNRKLDLVAQNSITPIDVALFKSITYPENGAVDNVLLHDNCYVINDFATEPEQEFWTQYAFTRKFKSSITLPLKKSGKTTNMLSLFSTKPNIFDQEEISLLEKTAKNVSFALDSFEMEKKRQGMEAQIKHSELQLKQAQAIAHFGSWEMDLATGLAEWAEETCRIFGIDSTDQLYSFDDWLSFIHPEDKEEVIRMTGEGYALLQSCAFHHRIIRKNGEIRHLFSQAQFEFDREGKPMMLHGVAHDVTDQKLAELERAKMIEDIVQRNKNLEQFSYIVSHNLRSPLANIMGISEVLNLPTLDKEKEKGLMANLSSSVKKLDAVIQDLNYILQIKNKEVNKWEVISLSGLLNDVIMSIENIINKEEVEIVSDFTAIDEIKTFKSYLNSIFFNLISNSIKYRRPDIKPMIEVSSQKVQSKIVLIFKDNGLGIDLNRKGEQVFGLYKRFHDHVEGKGMGLYMVKTQVESLGGKIDIFSKVNEGTEFRIEFQAAP